MLALTLNTAKFARRPISSGRCNNLFCLKDTTVKLTQLPT